MSQAVNNQNNNIVFEQKELWESYDKEGLIFSVKIPFIKQYIPQDVQSIIDIGCGNGIITNELAKSHQVTGVDISEEALQYVNTTKIAAACYDIPVSEKSFDLVFSSEMLEHLPGEVLHKTVAEFKRLSKKYILVTVPNQEFLPKSYLKCPQCDAVFHVSGHVNSFDLKAIEKLFAGDFELITHGYFGKRVREYNPLLQHIKHQYGHQWLKTSAYAVCPSCGNKQFEAGKDNFITKACNGANRLLSGKHPYWLLALFQKK